MPVGTTVACWLEFAAKAATEDQNVSAAAITNVVINLVKVTNSKFTFTQDQHATIVVNFNFTLDFIISAFNAILSIMVKGSLTFKGYSAIITREVGFTANATITALIIITVTTIMEVINVSMG